MNSSFSALNTAHSFSTTRKHLARKQHQNHRQGSFLLCFVVKLINLTVSKNCFSQLKKTAHFPYMTWRVNEFLHLNSCVKFSSNNYKFEVACYHCYATLENKTPAKTFPKFPLVLRVIDRSDQIHQLQPLV